MSEEILLEPNSYLLRNSKLKPKYFTYNTEQEYRIGNYLWDKQGKESTFVLDARFNQDNGDFSLGDESYELKENRGCLHSGEISLELLDTKNNKISGLAKSLHDGVDYFVIYMPTYENYKGKYQNFVDNLLVFQTKELYEWATQRDDLCAKNNRFMESSALCLKVPVSFITDSSSLSELIVNRIHIPENELKAIPVPEQIYSLFK